MEQPKRVVGVYPSEEAAAAAEAAARASGAADVSRDAPVDERASLLGEMREETEHTVMAPGNIGPFTKESAKGIWIGVTIGTIIGAILAVPVALFVGDALSLT